MLDKDELIYTKILNGNFKPKEIINYIDELHKKISRQEKIIKKEKEGNFNIPNKKEEKHYER